MHLFQPRKTQAKQSRRQSSFRFRESCSVDADLVRFLNVACPISFVLLRRLVLVQVGMAVDPRFRGLDGVAGG